MTQEALKQMYQLLLTEPHAPTVCAQLERIAREALAEHAMRETQRLGQEIEPDDIASILACRDMLDAQPVPPRTWVGSSDLEDSNAYLTPPQRTEQEPLIGCVNHDCDKCKAQTQEPVAWVSEDVCEGQYIDGRPRKIWWECEKGVGTAFYTTPPQRKPLTDKDILADETLRYYFGQNGGAGPVSKQGRRVVDAIEAAHGIKE